MVSKSPAIPRQELRDAEGQAFAYLVSAEEMHRLSEEMDDLRRQVATLQKQRDAYVGQLTEVLRTFVPPPPTEEEMLDALAHPNEITGLIAELEGKQ